MPRQHSTGGRTRLGGISKQGDRYLRRLPAGGATTVMRHVKDKPTPMANWIRKLSEKKLFRLVSVALAKEAATYESISQGWKFLLSTRPGVRRAVCSSPSLINWIY
nr:transposase [Novosphingobium sp. BW1]